MKLRVLNLYAGIGGNRKLWPDDEIEVTAVELVPEIAAVYQSFFPNDKVVVADAHQYLLEHYQEFDFIWSSPPCPTHSVCSWFLKGQGIIRYPDMGLYQEIIFLKTFFKGKWVVENVKPYYKPLIPAQEAGRHQFWANFLIEPIKYGIEIGTFNRQASNMAQMSTIIREAQIPGLIALHGFPIENIKLSNKRQVLRNCVNPKVGLHVFRMAFKEKQVTLDGI